MIFTISRGQCLVNDLPPCYCFVSVRVTLYLLPMCVTRCLVLLCDMISCSHSMYNAYPKLYVTCLSAFFPPLQPRVSRHSNARALALEMLYLAAYKTNFSQIYDFWSRVISPNPQTGHNSRLLCDACSVFKSERRSTAGVPGEL